MLIDRQPAQIRLEDGGCTVIHSGSTYPPKKVFVAGNLVVKTILKDLQKGEYKDVIISGSRENTTDELTIVELNLR